MTFDQDIWKRDIWSRDNQNIYVWQTDILAKYIWPKENLPNVNELMDICTKFNLAIRQAVNEQLYGRQFAKY